MTVVATTAPGAEERQTLFQFDAGKAEKLAAVSCALKFIKGGLTYNKTKALPQAAKDAAKDKAGIVSSDRVKGGSVNLFDSKENWTSAFKTAVEDVGHYFHSMSLDYPESQIRLFKQGEFTEFVAEFDRRVARATVAARNMDIHREEWLEKCKLDLGDQYNSEDYPANIEELLVLNWEPANTEPPKWLERLHPDEFKNQLAAQKEKMAEMYQTVQDIFLENAMQYVSAIKNCTEFVPKGAKNEKGTATKRTAAGGRVFQLSTVEHLVDFFDQVDRFGVEFDCPTPVREVMTDLKAVIQDRHSNIPTVAKLGRDLRTSGSFRAEVNEAFSAAHGHLERFREEVGERQSRAIKRKRNIPEEAIQRAQSEKVAG